MNGDSHEEAIGRALRRLREVDAGMTASPLVEARLRAAVRALGRQSQPWNRGLLIALAASLALCVSVPVIWWRSLPAQGGNGLRVIPVEAERATTEFFPLFYSSVPMSSGHIVRMQVPRTALARFGLAQADGTEPIAGTVQADVLVGDDGLARAVRFVRPLFQE